MCGILGVISLRGEGIPFSTVFRGLDVMRERGSGHGAGYAMFDPSPYVRVKAFFESAEELEEARSALRPVKEEVYQLPGGVLDYVAYVEDSAAAPRRGVVYSLSRWLNVFKGATWHTEVAKLYGMWERASPAWVGHIRYPTNSPGKKPYFSHPFSSGDVVIVHNGDLSSYGANVNLLMYRYMQSNFTGNDSEAIAFLLNALQREYGLEEAILELIEGARVRWARLDGPYAVAFILGGEKPVLGAFVDKQHFRPLYMGVDGDNVYVASEAAAIKAMSPRAEVWAMRGGEYVIVEDGRLYGNFRKRPVTFVHPPIPSNAVDASTYDTEALYREVHRLVEAVGEANVYNVYGHRYIASGLKRGVVRAWGVVGNASANVMAGGEFYIYGDAQDDLGDAMNGGLIAVYGNVGDTVGQAKRGGELYVYGNAGTRAAIQHRDGVLIIGGSAGDYLGEYMGGGTVVVLRHTNDEEVGGHVAAGMVGGTIYIRGRVPTDRIGLIPRWDSVKRYLASLMLDGIIDEATYNSALNADNIGEVLRLVKWDNIYRLFNMPPQVEYRELNEEELAYLGPYVARFNALFNTNASLEGEEFTVVKPPPKSH